MKPFGLRPGDGEKSQRTKRGRSTFIGNKFDEGPGSENGPKGNHKAAKMHDQRRQVHAQGRADERKLIHDAKKLSE
jgi:hypothetical protein